VGANGPPVFFVYPELVVSLSNHCRGACPEHLSRACRGIVEWVYHPLLNAALVLSSSKGSRLLAISWSRDGLFGPPVLFGFHAAP